MSGAAACITGATLTDPTMCAVLNTASMDALASPTFLPPVPIATTLLPPALQTAVTECTGSGTCKLLGYDFDTDTVVKASDSTYVVDTYSSSAENSGVLVTKGIKTTGTISGVTPDTVNGGSTGTVTYTGSNGTSYTFQARWKSVQVNGTYVDVYFDPANVSQGALTNDNIGVNPVKFIQPPGYELPDFQATVVTSANSLGNPTVSSVEECAARCDTTTGCKGFNFGGIDVATICELVNDTGTRAYSDNTSGFRKETISSTQTGDGSNPAGTDLGNVGKYCKEATQCNTDISNLITKNESATNPIAAFSTTDIESCAYCPIRTYNKTGHVTTNELRVSKTNATAQAAITSLQYSTDGTDATHMTLVHGGLYQVTEYERDVTDIDPKVIAVLGSNNRWKFLAANNGQQGIYNYPAQPINNPIYQVFATDYGYSYQLHQDFNLIDIDYVTNGFQLMDQDGHIYGVRLNTTDSRIYAGSQNLTAPIFSHDYNKTIFVFNPITLETFMNSIVGTYGQFDSNNRYSIITIGTPNPFIYSRNGNIYKIDLPTRTARKFIDDTMLKWYVDVNPTWSEWVNTNVLRDIVDEVFWNLFTIGSDMPDPYEALGQFRTFDIAPPTTAQQWSYARRQGCDKNCGGTPNGYAIYQCRGRDGVQCDPGLPGWTELNSCGGTHISCRPADDSADLKAQFSHAITGLMPASTKVVGGGSATTHNTDSLRIRTVYSRDASVISDTPQTTRVLIRDNTIFPSWVKSRLSTWVNYCPVGFTGATCSTCESGYYGVSCTLCTQPTAAKDYVSVICGAADTTITTMSCPSGQYPAGFFKGGSGLLGSSGTCTDCIASWSGCQAGGVLLNDTISCGPFGTQYATLNSMSENLMTTWCSTYLTNNTTLSGGNYIRGCSMGACQTSISGSSSISTSLQLQSPDGTKFVYFQFSTGGLVVFNSSSTAITTYNGFGLSASFSYTYRFNTAGEFSIYDNIGPRRIFTPIPGSTGPYTLQVSNAGALIIVDSLSKIAWSSNKTLTAITATCADTVTWGTCSPYTAACGNGNGLQYSTTAWSVSQQDEWYNTTECPSSTFSGQQTSRNCNLSACLPSITANDTTRYSSLGIISPNGTYLLSLNWSLMAPYFIITGGTSYGNFWTSIQSGANISYMKFLTNGTIGFYNSSDVAIQTYTIQSRGANAGPYTLSITDNGTLVVKTAAGQIVMRNLWNVYDSTITVDPLYYGIDCIVPTPTTFTSCSSRTCTLGTQTGTVTYTPSSGPNVPACPTTIPGYTVVSYWVSTFAGLTANKATLTRTCNNCCNMTNETCDGPGGNGGTCTGTYVVDAGAICPVQYYTSAQTCGLNTLIYYTPTGTTLRLTSVNSNDATQRTGTYSYASYKGNVWYNC